jgi:predicted SnoaL-like aldol condensation-catalyzing enzyme
MVAERKERAVGFLKLVVARKIAEAYRTYTAPGGRHHNVHFPAGFPALRQGMEEAHAKFPNTRIDVKHVVGEGDLVAVHSHVTMEPGHPGVAVVHLFRFDESDKIVELWDCGQPIPTDSPNADGAF